MVFDNEISHEHKNCFPIFDERLFPQLQFVAAQFFFELNFNNRSY